jgi:predicted ribosome quality control (RQC) complex YloA/Tae2 family protein
VASLAAAADRATQADAKSHAAVLLMANVHAIPGGASQATVTDWETGDDVVIPLGDGRTPAVDVAAAMYKEARRLRRGEEAVGPLLEAARTDVAEAEALAERLAALPGGGEAGGEGDEDASAAADRRAVLQEVRLALEAKGWLAPWREAGLEAMGAAAGRRAAKREGGGGGGPDGAPTFRRFTSPSGLAVLVGRSNRENDTLSLRVAAADDIWLHARGVPGAHVVLRAPAGKEADGGPSEEDIRFAAGLAAFFSKARDGGSVDVSHTLARNVKKPRGAPAGLVTLLAESVVRVRPDDVAGVVADASGSGGEEG